MHHTKKAFTLVELIVVIVILAILATIAFLSFSSQSASARDSTRLSDMSNIAKGLSVFNATSGKVPMPDGKVNIEASGTVISYQGYAGATVLNMIKISNGGKDPLDMSTYYTYSANASQSKFQILGFLEDGSSSALSLLPFGGNEVNADPSSYSSRYAITKGDQLGILLSSGTLVPVQAANTTVDLVKSNSGTVYKAIYGAESSGVNTVSSGALILSSIIIKSSDLIKDKNLVSMDDSLVGYWDMETTILSGGQTMIKDLSGKGNNGVCYNGTGTTICGNSPNGPQMVSNNGTTGKSMYFDGVDDSIIVSNSSSLQFGNSVTVLAKVSFSGLEYSSSTGVLNGIIGKGWPDASAPNTGIWYSYDNRWNGNGLGYTCFGNNAGGFAGGGNDFGIAGSKLFSDTNYIMGFSINNSVGRYFMNGTNVNGSKTMSGLNLANGYNLIIGGLSSNGYYMKGKIDELRIYNRGLSDSEVASIYNLWK